MKDGEAHLGKITVDMNIHPESDFQRLRRGMADEVRHFRLAGVHRQNPDPWEIDFAGLIAENGDLIDLLPLTDQGILLVVDETLNHMEVEAVMQDNGLTIACEEAIIRGPKAQIDGIRDFVAEVLAHTIIVDTHPDEESR